jgi:hypothetical protein
MTYDGGYAVGAYLGVDLGFRVHRMVGLFLGSTVQVSWADDPHIAVTVWGIHNGGIELDWTPRLFSTFESGFFWYVNARDLFWSPTIFYFTILGYRWGTQP